MLTKKATAVAFVYDAVAHLKVIGHRNGAQALMDKAGVVPDAGMVGFYRAAGLSRCSRQGPDLGSRAQGLLGVLDRDQRTAAVVTRPQSVV